MLSLIPIFILKIDSIRIFKGLVLGCLRITWLIWTTGNTINILRLQTYFPTITSNRVSSRLMLTLCFSLLKTASVLSLDLEINIVFFRSVLRGSTLSIWMLITMIWRILNKITCIILTLYLLSNIISMVRLKWETIFFLVSSGIWHIQAVLAPRMIGALHTVSGVLLLIHNGNSN